jgi:hypothetical protein
MLLILVVNGLTQKCTKISTVVISTDDTSGLLTAERNGAIANGLLSVQFCEYTNII